MLKTVISEIILAAITPLPFIVNSTFEETNVNYDKNVRYRYNDFLLVFSFIKLYIPCRFVLMSSYFQSSRAQRVTEMNGHKASYLFSIKCLTKDSPYLFVITNLLLCTFVFGYTIRIFDTDLNEESNHDFDQFRNPLWLTLVTMTTVGYGDFFSKSTPSRLLGIIIAFLGVYLTSLFVVTLSNALQWEKSEEKAFEMISSLISKEELKTRTIYVFTRSYHFRKSLKKANQSKWSILWKFWNWRGDLLKFKEKVNQIRGNFSYTEFDSISKDIIDMSEEVDKMKNLSSRLKEKLVPNQFKIKINDAEKLKN